MSKTTFRSTLGTFRDLPAQPNHPYLVESLLPEGSVVVLGGYGSSAKTWAATSLALFAAYGVPWLDFPSRKVSSAILDYEQGEYESRRRIRGLQLGVGISGRQPDIALCPYPPYGLNSPEFPLALEAVLVDRRVVFIDSLRAATPGLDENDSGIRVHIDAARRVPGAEKSCLVFLAHARKGGGDAREQLRGSGAIFDAADVVFMLAADDSAFTVTQTKNRFGQKIPPFQFRLEDMSGSGVRMARTTVADLGNTKVDPMTLKAVRRATASKPGISKRDLRKCVGGRGENVDAAIAKLEEDGVIKRLGRSGYHLVLNASGGTNE